MILTSSYVNGFLDDAGNGDGFDFGFGSGGGGSGFNFMGGAGGDGQGGAKEGGVGQTRALCVGPRAASIGNAQAGGGDAG